MVAAKQRRGSTQEKELGNKGSLLSLSSGHELKGAGGEIKVTRQSREETTKIRNCPSPGKRLREMYFPVPGLSVSSLYISWVS